MQSNNEAANEIVEQLRRTRLEAARLSAALAQLKYDLCVSQARVERALVKRVGSEKALAPTVEDRNRIFTLAVDADEEYRDILRRHNEVKLQLEETKVEATALQDRLDVLLAGMRAAESR